jgi:hypothetical protein
VTELDLVIEVKGGVVTAVYTDLDIKVTVDDLDDQRKSPWDVEEEGTAEVMPLTARE